MSKVNERIDDTGFGNIRILQDPDGFCYGTDAVLLAGFAASELDAKKKAGSVVDLGTCTGIVPLLLSHMTEIPRLAGIDINEDSVALGKRNVELNGLTGRMQIMRWDVRDAAAGLLPEELENLRAEADAVTSNPPYVPVGSGLESCGDTARAARHETEGSLMDFLKAADVFLKDKGSLFMVHRPRRLTDLMAMGREVGLEPRTLRLISGKKGTQPNIVLIRFVKGGGRELRVLPEMYVREDNGDFSSEMKKIYER